MKALFSAVAAAGMVLFAVGCNRQPQAIDKKIQWEYCDFEYKPYEQLSDGTHSRNYIQFIEGLDIKTGEYTWTKPENIYSATEALNEAGSYGWELAWSDGKHFIVKRQLRKGGGFTVSSKYEK